mmetsp:Transcript_116256/g.202163  ORF Transcript_116256/g.202163 Transcript_116256/m.202163 type:complete len:212 (+) Transcript_116256:2199-2834(+)
MAWITAVLWLYCVFGFSSSQRNTFCSRTPASFFRCRLKRMRMVTKMLSEMRNTFGTAETQFFSRECSRGSRMPCRRAPLRRNTGPELWRILWIHSNDRTHFFMFAASGRVLSVTSAWETLQRKLKTTIASRSWWAMPDRWAGGVPTLGEAAGGVGLSRSLGAHGLERPELDVAPSGPWPPLVSPGLSAPTGESVGVTCPEDSKRLKMKLII